VTENELLVTIASIRKSHIGVSIHTIEYENLLAENISLIDQGQRLLVSQGGNNSPTIWFAGRHYKSLAIFEQQINLLRLEQKSLTKQQQQALQIETKLQQKLDQKRGELACKNKQSHHNYH